MALLKRITREQMKRELKDYPMSSRKIKKIVRALRRRPTLHNKFMFIANFPELMRPPVEVD